MELGVHTQVNPLPTWCSFHQIASHAVNVTPQPSKRCLVPTESWGHFLLSWLKLCVCVREGEMCSLSWCLIYLKDLPGTCGDIPTEHMHLRGKTSLGRDHPAMSGQGPLPDLAPAPRPFSGHCLSISAPTRSRPTPSSVRSLG